MDINEILDDVLGNKSGYGSIVAQCHCGRTHFVHEDADYDEGEFDRLIKRRDAEPDKFTCHYDWNSVSTKDFNGQTWVHGCECNWHHRYATFIWAERETIIKFLKKCKEVKIKEALDIDKLLSGTNNI